MIVKEFLTGFAAMLLNILFLFIIFSGMLFLVSGIGAFIEWLLV